MPGGLLRKRAGQLRHRVRVERLTPQPRGDFGVAPTLWATLATDVCAEVLADSGREFFRSQQVQAQASHTVTIGDRPDLSITPADRLVWLYEGGNVVLNITAALTNRGTGTETKLACTQEV